MKRIALSLALITSCSAFAAGENEAINKLCSENNKRAEVNLENQAVMVLKECNPNGDGAFGFGYDPKNCEDAKDTLVKMHNEKHRVYLAFIDKDDENTDAFYYECEKDEFKMRRAIFEDELDTEKDYSATLKYNLENETMTMKSSNVEYIFNLMTTKHEDKNVVVFGRDLFSGIYKATLIENGIKQELTKHARTSFSDTLFQDGHELTNENVLEDYHKQYIDYQALLSALSKK